MVEVKRIGVLKENAPGERRVGLVPESVRPLQALGLDVLVETGAGRAACFPDRAFAHAGARLASQPELLGLADVLVGVRPPNVPVAHRYRAGQVLVCMLHPLGIPHVIRRWADDGLTAIGVDLIPRTGDPAQPMPATDSQEQLAGYTAVLVAANALGRCFPAPAPDAAPGSPARVLVIGAGPAGLSAATVARHLGAAVCQLGVREDGRRQAAGPGVGFWAPGSNDQAVRDALTASLGGFDVVIATAEVPGETPALLVTDQAVRTMRPGSVVIDTTAGPRGRTVESAAPATTALVDTSVTVIGDAGLAVRRATDASAAYARDITALLRHLLRDGSLVIDLGDPVQAATVVSHDRCVLHDGVWQRITDYTALAGLP